MKKFFPLTEVAQKSLAHLIVVVLVYIVASYVINLVAGILSILPIVNLIAGILRLVLVAYCTVGAIYAVLKYFGVVK